MATVFAAVAEERDGIATEPPVDVELRAATWRLEGGLVAVVEGEIVGSIHVDVSPHGFGEIGMAVLREWRGRPLLVGFAASRSGRTHPFGDRIGEEET